MTRVQTVGIAVAASVATLLAASAAFSQQPQSLTITFSNNPAGQKGAGPKCLASMSTSDKKKKVRRNDAIVWSLVDDVSNHCGGWNPQSVKLVFDTHVFDNVMALSGSAGGTIQKNVTKNSSNAPDSSVHPYIIRYDGQNAGDPELDVSGDNPIRGDSRGRGRGRQ